MHTKLTTRSEHVLRTLRHLDLDATRKRFERARNLFKFSVAHSAPLKYNCSNHRTHINYFYSHFKPRNRAAKTHLIQNLI